MKLQSPFNCYPKEPKHKAGLNAYLILCSTHKTASSFLDIFNKTQETNTQEINHPTDEEQDLLRAMLMFASAGLDSMAKQLVRDALSVVIEYDEGAESMFKKFIKRRLNREEKLDNRFLANVLGDSNPRQVLLNELIKDLTSQSLQSADQLLKTAAYFNVPSQKICDDSAVLKNILNVRNQISHETIVRTNFA